MSTEEKTVLALQINAALDEIRPHLVSDGGDVEVVEITDDMTVMVKWMGNCMNCSMSLMTMKAGIEHTIRNKFPFIKNVEAINGLLVNG